MAAPGKLARFLRGRLFTVSLISLAIILGMLFCYVRQPRLLRMLDYKVYDAMLHARADGQTSGLPVIVDLDDASLEAYGQWPWPRMLVAGLLSRIQQSGAKAVGVDVLLAEPDRSSPKQVRDDLKRFLNLDIGFSDLPPEYHDYDELLARFLNPGIVLAIYGRFSASGPVPGPVPGPGVSGSDARLDGPLPRGLGFSVRRKQGQEDLGANLLRADSVLAPLPVFWDKAPVGHIVAAGDEDGVLRRLPLIVRCRDKVYASLGLRTLMAAMGQRNVALAADDAGQEILRVGSLSIPIDPYGRFILPFRGPARTFPYYSARDVLDGSVGEEALRGKIVFIGTSAPGLLDIRATPLESHFPGVEVHATVVDAVSSGNFLRVPYQTPVLQLLGILLSGIMAGAAFGFARSRVYVPVAGLLFGGTVYASWHVFRQGLVVSPLYVCLTIAFLGAVLLALRFWQEERQKNVLRSAFSRYVAPEVVERITKLEGNIFAGEEVELSIMFTDIRGFTSISEKLDPRQIVTLLNRYFTPMTALVRGNKGTLDKFIGDALMAFWNAPVAVPDHPALAVRTALAMQETLTRINAGFHEEFGVDIRMGVGLHTGKAYVGNMGSEELLNYTLIGDNVNLASRLEGLCAQFGVGIVVSAETRERCGEDVAFLPLDTLRVKGKNQPVSVFAAMRPKDRQEREAEITRYLAAYEAYAAGRFARGLAAFSDLCEEFPNRKLYALYRERCARLAADPPADWDGVWTLTSK